MARELFAPVGGRALGLRSEGSWLAPLQLSYYAPGSSPAQLTAVQVGRAYARPTTNPAQGAPPPYPCRPAPHAPRRARAHPPCPSHRTIGRFAPLSHNSHTRVPTFVQGSTRAFERGAVRLLGMRFWSKNALYRPKNSSGAPPRAPGQDRTLGRVQGVLGGAAAQMYGAQVPKSGEGEEGREAEGQGGGGRTPGSLVLMKETQETGPEIPAGKLIFP